MNITQTMILTVFCRSLMKIVSLLFLMVFVCQSVHSQQSFIQKDYSILDLRLNDSDLNHYVSVEEQQDREEYPDPKSVLYKSMMIPGWGQIENRQAWKVPIIYGLFSGIGYYTYTVHQDYKDYRAAVYNAQRGEDTDFRFGPTPERLTGINTNQLQQNRNDLRNRRDLMFIVMFLAYGLNAADAYVFAHMRSFDVSDDLSATTTIGPDLIAGNAPGLRLSIQLNKK